MKTANDIIKLLEADNEMPYDLEKNWNKIEPTAKKFGAASRKTGDSVSTTISFPSAEKAQQFAAAIEGIHDVAVNSIFDMGNRYFVSVILDLPGWKSRHPGKKPGYHEQ